MNSRRDFQLPHSMGIYWHNPSTIYNLIETVRNKLYLMKIAKPLNRLH